MADLFPADMTKKPYELFLDDYIRVNGRVRVVTGIIREGGENITIMHTNMDGLDEREYKCKTQTDVPVIAVHEATHATGWLKSRLGQD